MYNYVNLVGVIKEVNRDERYVKIEVRRYEPTTLTVYLAEELAPAYQQPILVGKVVAIKGYLTLDSSGAIIIIGERIFGFENKESE